MQIRLTDLDWIESERELLLNFPIINPSRSASRARAHSRQKMVVSLLFPPVNNTHKPWTTPPEIKPCKWEQLLQPPAFTQPMKSTKTGRWEATRHTELVKFGQRLNCCETQFGWDSPWRPVRGPGCLVKMMRIINFTFGWLTSNKWRTSPLTSSTNRTPLLYWRSPSSA